MSLTVLIQPHAQGEETCELVVTVCVALMTTLAALLDGYWMREKLARQLCLAWGGFLQCRCGNALWMLRQAHTIVLDTQPPEP